MMESKTLPELVKKEPHSLKRGPFGGSLKKDMFVESGYMVYEQQHAIYKTFNSARYFISEKKYQELNVFKVQAKDLIVSCSGTIGKIAEIPENHQPGVINQALLKISLDNTKVLNEYFIQLFQSPKIQSQLFDLSHGTGLVNFPPMSVLNKIKFPLPPLSEQKRIAELLDAADTLRKKDKALLEKYDQLAQSLFLEMFGGSDFEKYELGTLCEIKGGKRLPKGKDFSDNPSDIPYLRVTDFRPNSFDDSKLKYVDNETSSEIKRYRISKEDVYISIAGTIGIAGLIPDHLHDSQLTENAAKLVIKDKTTLNKVFLSYFLNSEDCQNEIKPRTMAVGVPKLALFRLAELNIKLPSITLQNQFAEQVKLIEKQKEIAKKNLEKSEELMKGLMGEVFG